MMDNVTQYMNWKKEKGDRRGNHRPVGFEEEELKSVAITFVGEGLRTGSDVR
jgi:hypothetical protein